MIRAATLADGSRLLELVKETHARSIYPAMDVEVSESAARAVLRDAIMRHGRTNEGATLCNVFEHEGKIVGFMVGILQRIHLVGNRLEAQDLWLYCCADAPARASSRLLDAYIEWASGNPKVAEIMLSWTDSNGADSDRIARLYKRKGFERRGELWKRAGQ